jgi:GNAT superfamily N-acetyltransferase
VAFRIRPPTAGDGPALREVVRTTLVEYGLPPDPGGADADLDDVSTFYLARGGIFVVVVDDADAVVGTMGVLPRAHGRCELRKMYLLKEARGHGVGKRLLEHALAEAKRLGFAVMELETVAPLKEAIALYERYGFTRVDRPLEVSRCDRAYERAL